MSLKITSLPTTWSQLNISEKDEILKFIVLIMGEEPDLRPSN
jgi:hypothetical protein